MLEHVYQLRCSGLERGGFHNALTFTRDVVDFGLSSKELLPIDRSEVVVIGCQFKYLRCTCTMMFPPLDNEILLFAPVFPWLFATTLEISSLSHVLEGDRAWNKEGDNPDHCSCGFTQRVRCIGIRRVVHSSENR